MSILQGLSHLRDVGDNGVEWEQRPAGVALTQSAIGSIVHHQKGSHALNTEVQNLDDMGMPQMGNGTCLAEKVFSIIACQLAMQYFNGSLGVQVNMLPQVDFREAPLS